MNQRPARRFSLAGPLLALLLASPMAAQPPCDSLHTIPFTYSDLGGYMYGFSILNPDTNISINMSEWAFLGEGHMANSYGQTATNLFPGAASYLVCLRTDLWGDQTDWCESVYCELVEVPVDPACTGLVADFTITLEGDSIRFVDLSSGPGGTPIQTWHWDLGDGSSSDTTSPLHLYPGNGPYKACLTVSNGPCTATACNWIYTGPPNVPCAVLLQPSIDVLQYRQVIAAYDRSITSGMHSSLIWDFGDGSTGTGNPALHAYVAEGTYQVCGETTLWGPLTQDTCMAHACEVVQTWSALGIGQPQVQGTIRAWPIPFQDVLTVEHDGRFAVWELFDLVGARQLKGRLDGSGSLSIPGAMLTPGSYLLRLSGPGGARTLPVMKAP
ncbi:MAG TPA: PKD domain-containing protein [Flavobacteriales bacterium]|nr:PKD domain-containing protein [Flavobacteriales bacterium]